MTTSQNRFTRYTPHVVRVLLGIPFLLAGTVGLFHLVPDPEPIPPLIAAFKQTGYMVPLISATELAAGLLLLGNRFVPLGLTILAPVTLNILLYHIFLDPATTFVAVVFLAMHLYLAWCYRSVFRPMLASRVAPAA